MQKSTILTLSWKDELPKDNFPFLVSEHIRNKTAAFDEYVSKDSSAKEIFGKINGRKVKRHYSKTGDKYFFIRPDKKGHDKNENSLSAEILGSFLGLPFIKSRPFFYGVIAGLYSMDISPNPSKIVVSANGISSFDGLDKFISAVYGILEQNREGTFMDQYGVSNYFVEWQDFRMANKYVQKAKNKKSLEEELEDMYDKNIISSAFFLKSLLSNDGLSLNEQLYNYDVSFSAQNQDSVLPLQKSEGIIAFTDSSVPKPNGVYYDPHSGRILFYSRSVHKDNLMLQDISKLVNDQKFGVYLELNKRADD